MKTKLFLFLIFTMLFSISFAEENTINLMIDGNQVTYSNQLGYPFIDESNRTQMPLRACLDTYGAETLWDSDNNMVITVKNDIMLRIPIGQNHIFKNSEKIEIDSPAQIVNGRTYLPIRAVMEAFECTVEWDNATKTIVVTQNDFSGEKNNASSETHNEAVLLNTHTTQLPDTFDARNVFGSTPVKNQRHTGACWAFATNAVLETTLAKEASYDFSEDNIIYNNDAYSHYTSGGSTFSVFGYLSGWRGPVLEKDDKFLDYKSNPDAEVVKHVQEIEFIDSDIETLKMAIQKYGAVQHSFFFNQSSHFFNEDTNAYFLSHTDEEYTNHIVALVGWDDNYSKENFTSPPEKDGAFIAKNSWGSAFGDHGYFYISYEDPFFNNINNLSTVFTRVEDPDNYDHIYQYDDAGYTNGLGYDDSEAWFSNVFDKQSENEVLEAVSFYTLDKNSNYWLYYVDEFDTVADFERINYIGGGSIKNPGYHTIDFDSIPLSATGKFAVIVAIETPGTKYPIAIEMPNKGAEDAQAEYFQSFMSYGGYHWSDTAMHYNNSNVCLKAFTTESLIQ